jgi:putative transposase
MANPRRGPQRPSTVCLTQQRCDDSLSPVSSPASATGSAWPSSAPSLRSARDSFDNALAEAVNGLYKAELIRGPDQGPWRTVEDVELATLGWVHWHNNERLHGYLADVPPVEFEASYAAQHTDQNLVGTQ